MFAPCEKVIISQDENNPTLIAILTSLTLQVPVEEFVKLAASPNERPMIAMRWSVFAMWGREDGDADREFRQLVEICAPDKSVLLSTPQVFKFKSDIRTHRNTIAIQGFPLSTVGDYEIRLSLDGEQIASFPLELKGTPPAQPA